jgi:hypothetical protein
LGRYRTPRLRVGSVLACDARECDVIVTGYSGSRIPWPVGHGRGGGRPGLVVFGGLARAVRRESNQAVAHWFGVGPATVARWREALGAEAMNAGSARLRAAVARDPERCAKIAAARVGKPRPPHVIDAMRKGRTGKPHTAEARAKMRAAHAARLGKVRGQPRACR